VRLIKFGVIGFSGRLISLRSGCTDHAGAVIRYLPPTNLLLKVRHLSQYQVSTMFLCRSMTLDEDIGDDVQRPVRIRDIRGSAGSPKE
jgi:hypothetical protein